MAEQSPSNDGGSGRGSAPGGSEYGSFPPTQWSLVNRAGRGTAGEEAQRQSLGALLKRYLPALRTFLVYRKGMKPDRADDLLQGFVADKIVEQGLIAGADRKRGRFRSYLLTALNHYHISQIRKAGALKRAPADGEVVGFEDYQEPADPETQPDVMFDVAWAREVIAEATRRTEAECRDAGREELWGLLQGRILAPATEGAQPLSYDELVVRFGLTSPVQVSNMLVTARRMFARNLKGVIREYARDDAEVEDEIRDLKRILASA